MEAHSTTSDSITLSWTIPEGNIIDNYTLTVIRLCDNVVFTPTTGINGNDTQYTITGLYSGLQYTVGIIPLNILGTGMESNVNATVMDGTGKLLVYLMIYNGTVKCVWSTSVFNQLQRIEYFNAENFVIRKCSNLFSHLFQFIVLVQLLFIYLTL